MPDLNGIVPTIFSVASSMIQNWFGYEPMISVPLPAVSFGLSAVRTDSDARSISAAATAHVRFIVLISVQYRGRNTKTRKPKPTDSVSWFRDFACFVLPTHARLREYQIDLPPVLLRRGALRGPI